MYSRIIDIDIQVSLSMPQFAQELFDLTDKNRQFLKKWLPWIDSVEKPSDTQKFIELQLSKFSKGEVVHQTILYKEKIAGVLGFNLIDQINQIGYLGYWLGEEYNGLGIMTKSVQDLINQGFQYWNLQRIDIRCAVNNTKSRAIPERLGFKNEGIIRRAEKVYDIFYDHVIYGLLKG